MRERTPGPVALHGWALLLHSATQKFINEAGSDRISYVVFCPYTPLKGLLVT